MTKVEQLKARAYAIDILEENKKEGEEPSNWDLQNLETAKKELQMIEYIIEEIAK